MEIAFSGAIRKEIRPMLVPQDNIGSPKVGSAFIRGSTYIIGRIRYVLFWHDLYKMFFSCSMYLPRSWPFRETV